MHGKLMKIAYTFFFYMKVHLNPVRVRWDRRMWELSGPYTPRHGTRTECCPKDFFFSRGFIFMFYLGVSRIEPLFPNTTLCVFLFHVKLYRTMPVKYSDRRSGDQKGPTNQISQHFQGISDTLIPSWRRLSCTSWKHSCHPLIEVGEIFTPKCETYRVDTCYSLPRYCGIVEWIVSFFTRCSEIWFLWHVGTNLKVNMCNTTR